MIVSNQVSEGINVPTLVLSQKSNTETSANIVETALLIYSIPSSPTVRNIVDSLSLMWV